MNPREPWVESQHPRKRGKELRSSGRSKSGRWEARAGLQAQEKEQPASHPPLDPPGPAVG